MDLIPGLAERFMAEGKLPNLKRLASEGSYRRLRTTFPALSPVAWSTFATGVNPGKHNIFDFLNRDLRSYTPELSSSRVSPPRRYLRFGPWNFAVSKPVVEMRRKSTPFWKILGDHAIGSTILRVPITFPPDDFKGRLLSAMSTPDLRGTQGAFSFFSTRSPALSSPPAKEGPVILSGAVRMRSAANSKVPGISRSLSASSMTPSRSEMRATRCSLREYTPWIRVAFRSGPGISVHGIVRFLLTETGAETSLYATPVQIDPENPALPISQPYYYAAYLSKLLGPFCHSRHGGRHVGPE